MKRNTARFTIAASLFLVLSAGAASCTGADAPAETATAAVSAEWQMQNTFLGDFVVKDGCYVSALWVEDPAQPGVLYVPQAGKRLVAVQIVVGNMSGQRFRVNPYNVSLIDEQGAVHPPVLGAREGQIATIDIDEGEKAQGWVPYQIPDGALPAGLQISREVFGAPFFVIGILPPPESHATVALSYDRPTPSLPSLGEIVEGQGRSFTALRLEDPAEPTWVHPLKPGNRLIAVEVAVRNGGADVLLVSPLYFVLVDTDGFVYPASVDARDGQIETVDLNTGSEIRGWVAFDIPAGATPESIKFMPSLLPEDTLQAGLAD
jgi:hypothetical protein